MNDVNPGTDMITYEDRGRAIVFLPYLHSQDGPKTFIWVIPQDQNVPGYYDCDIAEFVKRHLAAAAAGERDVPLFVLAMGKPFVILLNDDGRPVFDRDHDQEALCRCGHPYFRHFDGYDFNAAVGCKYCDCEVFVAATREKHQTFACSKCRALLNLDGKTCEVCGEEVEPEPYSVLRHEARVRDAAEREAEAIADDQPRDWEKGNEGDWDRGNEHEDE